MKNKTVGRRTVELDVDFIGGQGALTKEEEKQISEFIQSQKLLRARTQISRTTINKREKALA